MASVAGGPVRTLLEGTLPWPHWGGDGSIYATMVDTAAGPMKVVRVAASGGTSETLWRIPEEEVHFVLRVLPDSRSALTLSVPSENSDAPEEVRLVDLSTGESTTITPGSFARYLPSGELFFVAHDSTLMVGRMDRSGELSEGATPLVEDVVAFDVADDGTLFYTAGENASPHFELVWVTRDGSALPVEAGWTFDPDFDNRGWEISPDGSKIALKARTNLGNDIWVMELPEGPMSRLTIHAAPDRMPRWHPNGTDVTFASSRGGTMEVWSRRADGVGDAALVYADPRAAIVDFAWSPDARWLIVRTSGTVAGAPGGRRLEIIELGVDSLARPLLDSGFDEYSPAISPDGAWLAYVSLETGQPDVFLRPFPNVNDGKVAVSDGGGRAPVWSTDGSEIFYLTGEGTAATDASLTQRSLMVAELRRGPPMAVTRRRQLFEIPEAFYFANYTTSFDVAPDGERFLMARIANQETPDRRRFVLVKNALTEFRQRVR